METKRRANYLLIRHFESHNDIALDNTIIDKINNKKTTLPQTKSFPIN